MGFDFGSVFGGLFDDDDPPPYSAQTSAYYQQALQGFFNQFQDSANPLWSAVHGTQQNIIDRTGELYDTARTRLGEEARLGRQQISDTTGQAFAESQQAAIDAGLSGGTGQMATNRAIASDSARQIAGLESQIGQLYAGLDTGQAAAETQAMQNYSNMIAQQIGSQQQMLSQQLSGTNQTPLTAPAAPFGQQLMSSAMQFLPFAFL